MTAGLDDRRSDDKDPAATAGTLMTHRSCLTIVLAAGDGTRMKSDQPKVLHRVGGLPMVAHVVKAAQAAGATNVALVVGSEGARVAEAVSGVDAFTQTERLGTAHAVLSARSAIRSGYDDVLVLYGDTPLIDPQDLVRAREKLAEGASVVAIGFRPPNPSGYGRLIEAEGSLVAIREEKDCSVEEMRIGFCNAGLMAMAGNVALDLLEAVGNANAKSEYYLTDVVEIAARRGLSVVATEARYESVLGINTRVELAEAEAVFQASRRRTAMLSGVTMVAPETVFLSFDTMIGPDTVIEPNVFFGPGVTVGRDAKIHASCHFEGATIGDGCEVGPFARLRPGADLRKGSKVGNFCEVKKSVIEEGAKINHLSYIGDATVGSRANVGAGTITCNYDGYNKFRTEIGQGAFVGSNTSLVAPVSIGNGAYVASGSVITENVPDEALAFGRARQKNLPERARQLRQRQAALAKK